MLHRIGIMWLIYFYTDQNIYFLPNSEFTVPTKVSESFRVIICHLPVRDCAIIIHLGIIDKVSNINPDCTLFLGLRKRLFTLQQ